MINLLIFNSIVICTYDECSNVGKGKIKQIDVCSSPAILNFLLGEFIFSLRELIDKFFRFHEVPALRLTWRRSKLGY